MPARAGHRGMTRGAVRAEGRRHQIRPRQREQIGSSVARGRRERRPPRVPARRGSWRTSAARDEWNVAGRNERLLIARGGARSSPSEAAALIPASSSVDGLETERGRHRLRLSVARDDENARSALWRARACRERRPAWRGRDRAARLARRVAASRDFARSKRLTGTMAQRHRPRLGGGSSAARIRAFRARA